MHCDWFILPLLLPTLTIWFSLDRKRRGHKQSRKKMETFQFFRLRFHRAYDCLRLRFFIFTKSAFTTPTTTPSLVKTSLKRTNVGCPVIYSPACLLDVSSVHPLNLLSLCLLLLSTMVKESKKGKWWKNWSLPKEETFSVLKHLFRFSKLAVVRPWATTSTELRN